MLSEVRAAREMKKMWDDWIQYPRSTRALHMAELMATRALDAMTRYDKVQKAKQK